MSDVEIIPGERRGRALKVVRWAARVWSAILFLFWGIFFLSHMGWFARPGERPPVREWWMMVLHLALLIGLAIGFRWELTGAVMVLVSAPLFFFLSFTVGEGALAYTVLTIIPAILWLICGLLTRRGISARSPF